MGVMRNVAALAALVLASGGALAQEVSEVRIAQQFGIGYLPMTVVKEQKLLERFVREAGLPEPKVTWTQVSGAAAMNDALLTGNLDFASAGVAPMITMWARTKGRLDVRGVTSLGSMPNYLNTSNPAVKSLADFGEKDRIALPAVKVGFQAVLLQMAAAEAFGKDNYGKLDPITVSMSHPDATIALLGGRSEVTAHFASPPFQEQQLQDPRVHRVLSSYDVLGGPHSFNIVYATGKFRDANPKTVAAFVAAIDAANDFIARNPKEAAALYIKAENSKLEPAFVENLVTDKATRFTSAPENTMKFAEFMHQVGLIKEKPASWKDLFVPELHGKAGS
ncbi:ABC transporter substrate-binding protein [Arenibaculum pallidiluteum]|uniref:ABC transporter substrate-binding protein n=1 Tax=Arenibaculum pallidiluteum TaxID=2812559 RepID=UPI001A958804|nr:ABC transporter substrate-binding protein [Arenibaculum pallidiluteum]